MLSRLTSEIQESVTARVYGALLDQVPACVNLHGENGDACLTTQREQPLGGKWKAARCRNTASRKITDCEDHPSPYISDQMLFELKFLKKLMSHRELQSLAAPLATARCGMCDKQLVK